MRNQSRPPRLSTVYHFHYYRNHECTPPPPTHTHRSMPFAVPTHTQSATPATHARLLARVPQACHKLLPPLSFPSHPTRHAPPRTRRAHATHTPRIRHARATHTPRHAHAPHTPRTRPARLRTHPDGHVSCAGDERGVAEALVVVVDRHVKVGVAVAGAGEGRRLRGGARAAGGVAGFLSTSCMAAWAPTPQQVKVGNGTRGLLSLR